MKYLGKTVKFDSKTDISNCSHLGCNCKATHTIYYSNEDYSDFFEIHLYCSDFCEIHLYQYLPNN